MTSESKNRVLLLGALLVAGAALALIAWGKIGDNLVYYWSPAEMLAQGDKAYGPTIRLGGVVAKDSIKWNEQHTALTFDVANGKEATDAKVTVSCTETPPAMFRENIGVVVEGTWDKSRVFHSNRLMVSHSNEYRPPKEGESTKDWQKTLEASTN